MLNRKDWIIGALIGLSYLSIGLYTIEDYGVTWDEPYHFNEGILWLKFFLSGNWSRFPPVTGLALGGGRPPVINVLSAITYKLFYGQLHVMSEVAAHHVATLIMASLTVFVVYLLSVDAFDRFTALAATSFLVSFPRFFGHAHMNIKDVPFTGLFVCTLFVFWKGFKAKNWKLIVSSGIFLGLTAGRRPYALFLVPATLFLWLIICQRDMIGQHVTNVRHGPTERTDSIAFLIALSSFPLIGVMTLVFVWPWLWADPVSRLLDVVSATLSFAGGFNLPVLYMGEVVPANEVPWHYPLVMLAVTTPSLTLMLGVLGILFAFQHIWKLRTPSYSLVLAWFLISVAKPSRVKYGGIRLYFEAVPALCIFAGIGCSIICKWISARRHRLRFSRESWDKYSFSAHTIVALLFVAVLCIPSVIAMIRIHPYESSYYNDLIGGIPGASEQFEIIYWGEVYKEGCSWLNRYAKPNATIGVPPLNHQIVNYYLRPDLSIITAADLPEAIIDYYMFMTYSPGYTQAQNYCLENLSPSFSVSVDGIPILHIYNLTTPKNQIVGWSATEPKSGPEDVVLSHGIVSYSVTSDPNALHLAMTSSPGHRFVSLRMSVLPLDTNEYPYLFALVRGYWNINIHYSDGTKHYLISRESLTGDSEEKKSDETWERVLVRLEPDKRITGITIAVLKYYAVSRTEYESHYSSIMICDYEYI